MYLKKVKEGNKECEILSGDEGLKDILQFLKEQSKKMERLDMALRVIQDGMRQNTRPPSKRVLERLPMFWAASLTHECLINSGVKIQ